MSSRSIVVTALSCVLALTACGDDQRESGVGTAQQDAGTDHLPSSAVSSTAADAGEVVDSGTHSGNPPLIFFVVDSSGSMERTMDCQCTTPGCEECLPDCDRAQRNKFQMLVEALTGTSEAFSCQTLARTSANGATYDVGYYLPYHKPAFGTQRLDGVLDSFSGDARFGLATFDGVETYYGVNPLIHQTAFDTELSDSASGQWSYGAAAAALNPNKAMPGRFFYPKCLDYYFMDTGIRGPQAEDGALQLSFDTSDQLVVNAQIQSALLEVRPYGGTPTAAALDDLYYLFGEDPKLKGRLHDRPQDRYVVLITDGYPDDDFRSYGCNCVNESDDQDAGTNTCGALPAADVAKLTCPYPPAATAARFLVEGRSHVDGDTAQRKPGPRQVQALYVVGFGTFADRERQALDDIAAAGKTKHATTANDTPKLNAALGDVIRQILHSR